MAVEVNEDILVLSEVVINPSINMTPRMRVKSEIALIPQPSDDPHAPPVKLIEMPLFPS